MLVLLSFLLVLVATVLLVLGLLSDDGLTLIYVSIASSIAAAVVLIVALRMSKPASEAPLADGDATPDPAPARAADRTAVTPVPAEEDEELEEAADEEEVAADGTWLASDVDDDGWSDDEEVDFPIADYDSLSVAQIMPLLPQLYTDEIEIVEERERATKARSQILNKLAQLRAEAGDEDPLASYTEPPAEDAAWADDDDDWFPIEDYESLSAAQILPLIPELDEEELTLVRTRELSLGRRRSILDEIDRELGITPTKKAPARKKKAAAKKAPATKKAATKKAATKKAPAKKASAKKKAPARKAPAKKAPAKKASAKKAPARKAPAKKAPAKKAPAKKARKR